MHGHVCVCVSNTKIMGGKSVLHIIALNYLLEFCHHDLNEYNFFLFWKFGWPWLATTDLFVFSFICQISDWPTFRFMWPNFAPGRVRVHSLWPEYQVKVGSKSAWPNCHPHHFLVYTLKDKPTKSCHISDSRS